MPRPFFHKLIFPSTIQEKRLVTLPLFLFLASQNLFFFFFLYKFQSFDICVKLRVFQVGIRSRICVFILLWHLLDFLNWIVFLILGRYVRSKVVLWLTAKAECSFGNVVQSELTSDDDKIVRFCQKKKSWDLFVVSLFYLLCFWLTRSTILRFLNWLTGEWKSETE